jgi:DNA-binding MarR family transcriptional regulator
MTEWLNDKQQRTWREFLQVKSRLDVELNRQLQECNDLSQSDYAVLVELNEAAEGRLRPVELGAVLAWEQSRLSHHLSRMVKRGLVVREECTSDRRGAYVVLTRAGKHAIITGIKMHTVSRILRVVQSVRPVSIVTLRGIIPVNAFIFPGSYFCCVIGNRVAACIKQG